MRGALTAAGAHMLSARPMAGGLPGAEAQPHGLRASRRRRLCGVRRPDGSGGRRAARALRQRPPLFPRQRRRRPQQRPLARVGGPVPPGRAGVSAGRRRRVRAGGGLERARRGRSSPSSALSIPTVSPPSRPVSPARGQTGAPSLTTPHPPPRVSGSQHSGNSPDSSWLLPGGLPADPSPLLFPPFGGAFPAPHPRAPQLRYSAPYAHPHHAFPPGPAAAAALSLSPHPSLASVVTGGNASQGHLVYPPWGGGTPTAAQQGGQLPGLVQARVQASPSPPCSVAPLFSASHACAAGVLTVSGKLLVKRLSPAGDRREDRAAGGDAGLRVRPLPDHGRRPAAAAAAAAVAALGG